MPTFSWVGLNKKDFLAIGKAHHQSTPPHLWSRYIDDIMFIWDGNAEELEEFIKHLNKQHETIKFTATYNVETHEIPFLDMTVSINEEGQIITDLYKKETARVQYLLPSSCHPAHITKNIPFSLAYRLKRICSEPEIFSKRLEELRHDLISRNYNPKIIETAFQKVKCIPRQEALKNVVRSKTSDREPFCVTYHPSLPSVAQTVRNHHKVSNG